MKFVAGLGNPGKRYQWTPHNVGFLVVDLLHAGAESPAESWRNLWRAEVAKTQLEAQPVWLLKPQTYMNLSGQAVRDILGYFKGEPGDLLVLHDDLDQPLGQLRFRASGSSGGHRGIDSLVEALGTRDFHRLKIGIGRDERRDPADYVLAPFGASREEIDRILARAAQAVRCWLREGIDRAATQFNTRLSESKSDPDKETGA